MVGDRALPFTAIRPASAADDPLRRLSKLAVIVLLGALSIVVGLRIDARELGPALPRTSSASFVEVPVPLPLPSLADRWSILCLSDRGCSLEEGLMPAAVAGLLSRASTRFTATSEMQVLVLGTPDAWATGAMPPVAMQIGAAAVRPIVVEEDALAWLQDRLATALPPGRAAVVDPRGRLYAGIDLRRSPIEVIDQFVDVFAFFRAELRARLL